MTKIIVLHDDHEVDEFDFAGDVTRITIGRRPSNDVCIADRSVSGGHAQLLVDESSLLIEDLSSTNGTYVNGRAVNSHVLADGDDLLIGKVRLRIESASRANAASVPPVSPAHAPVARPEADRDAVRDGAHERVEAPRAAAFLDDDDDELDESMRAALALYSHDPVDEFSSAPAFVDEDDDLDFSEDARLFAQSGVHADPLSETDSAPIVADIDDDRLPDARDDVSSDAGLQTLNDRAKAALGRDEVRPRLHAVPDSAAVAETTTTPTAAPRERIPVTSHANEAQRASVGESHASAVAAHPMDDLQDEPLETGHDADRPRQRSRGAVIEIKNGAKSGQILPIDKPVTTLGRPGIQIAAIMRKPDGYFLMHIESADDVERPTLNANSIGDEPVLLHSGDALNVAGIDVKFMLS